MAGGRSEKRRGSAWLFREQIGDTFGVEKAQADCFQLTRLQTREPLASPGRDAAKAFLDLFGQDLHLALDTTLDTALGNPP